MISEGNRKALFVTWLKKKRFCLNWQNPFLSLVLNIPDDLKMRIDNQQIEFKDLDIEETAD